MMHWVAERKRLRLLLVLLLSVQLFPPRLFADDDLALAVSNVKFELAGNVVYIVYDIQAPAATKMCRVSLTLFRESDPGFVYRPVNVSGDIGPVIVLGGQRRILWEMAKELPAGLPGDDYFFVVEAAVIKEETASTPWLWVGGGALLVGGIVTYLVLSGGEETQTITPTGFPAPPGRP